MQSKRAIKTAGGNAASVSLLGGLILLYSLIISLYVITVRQATLRGNSQDAVEQAALSVARELPAVTVSYQHFGAVGLLDLPEGSNSLSPPLPMPVSGLNSLFATLRLDAILATKLNYPFMSALVGADLAQAHRLEKDLIQSLERAIRPNYYLTARQGAPRSLYQTAYKLAANGKQSPEERLVDLKITLGCLKGNSFSSLVETPGTEEERGLDFVSSGCYRPLVLIPVPESHPVKFYQQAARTQLVRKASFYPGDGTVAPSAVLVEATYKAPSKNGREDILRTRSACAIVGSPPVAPASSVFMVSFPHGIPPQLRSLKDLLSFKAWKSSGEWQQAVGGAVPGRGRLEPPLGLDAAEMNPGEAIQMAIYHWLLHAGHRVKLEALEQLLARQWTGGAEQAEAGAEATGALPNSALTKDVGARSFALLYQSGQGGAGQEILKKAFDADVRDRNFPRSAFPLLIDQEGRCNTVGHKGFDRKLVMDFMSALHKTNLAAIESGTTARAVEERMDLALAQIDQQLPLVKEELCSVNQRLDRMNSAGSATTAAAEAKLFNLLLANQLQLNQTLCQQTEKRQNYLSVKRRASIVADNALKAAARSFEVCSDIGQIAEGGLYRVDGSSSFLLGKQFIFNPCLEPATEEAIYKAQPGANKADWTSPEFSVLMEAPASTQTGGICLAALRQQAPAAARGQGLFVVLQSAVLTGQHPAQLELFDHSPFSLSGIASGELGYYAQDTIRTGKDPEVGWSVLLRDEVACRTEASGQPLASAQPRWCTEQGLEMSTCPGLAAEVQIRSPLPVIPDLPVGSYLTNPKTGERVSQIPPMPAGML